MSNSIPLSHLVELFGALFAVGVGLTLPLFQCDYRRFIHSSLFIKILFWVPIFVVFLGVLYANNTIRVVLLVGLLALALREFLRVARTAKAKLLITLYFVFFTLGLSHFYLLGNRYQSVLVDLLITLCFATVLSDVVAFFFGNYLGGHTLPAWLNDRKSWEGVAGQVVGALLGILLVSVWVVPGVNMWLFLPLGIGSVLGDLANSFAKRRARVKDWSNAIPGHGGFIDRLSSMSGSAALLFYFLLIGGRFR